MERRGITILVVLIIILVIGSSILMFKFQKSNPEELRLSSKDKEYLLDLAYRSIKVSINENKRLIEPPHSKLSNYNNEVFVNLEYNSAGVGSYIGSSRDIINNVITAAIGATQDKDYKKLQRNGIQNEELENLKVHISIVESKQLIRDKSLDSMEKEINLGEDYIRLATLDRKEATYSTVVMLSNNWSYEEALGNLCLKLKKNYPILKRFDENCWKDVAFNIYKLEMIKFEKEFTAN
ncbi:AMMECR1 domain-containing protein [Candidatus Woesearchaeota archaeon]|nr:AMMECR1 domain-containing protein [Candidatus Woesearchaeota archaeon]